MFSTAELRRTVPKEEYAEQAPKLRQELLEVQRELKEAPFPVLVVFGGVDGAGKSESVNLLHGWLDPRWIFTHAYGETTQEMAERPEFWRYWRDLPPHGRVGIFLSAWYSDPLLDRVYRKSSESEFDDELDRVVAFEKELADDGALIVKFWMHLGKKEQKERFKQLEKDPLTSWRVGEKDWEHLKLYGRFVEAAERLIARTSRGRTPWHIVEGYDERYRILAVTGTLVKRIREHLHEMEMRRKWADERRKGGENSTATADAADASYDPAPGVSVLSTLDTSKSLEKKKYERKLEKWQGELNLLARKARDTGLSTILVFEGWDAAGKGGAIRRVSAALDARYSQVIPIQAPTDEELRHHYLWRFWRHLPRAGRVTIFDRSWYGRVLVERVEGFADEHAWKRAYAEINGFEEQLVESGIVLCKFWMHITKEEQLARFERRKELPYKRWKLTDDDWRNREKWDLYEAAVNEMVERTSTSIAPWTLVEANDKRYARIKVLKTVCKAMKASL